MVSKLRFIFPLSLVLLFCYACGSPNDGAEVSDKQTQPVVNLDSIIDFENSKNEWKRSNIYLKSRLESDSNSQFDQYPRVEELDQKSNSFVLHYQWRPDQIFSHHDMFIEIKDRSKIEMNKTYSIPHDNFKVRVVYYGVFSNFELFKKVKGTIRFSSLQGNYCNLQLDLVGELSEMIKQKDTEIFKGELNILKDYSCYRGYAPENKLNINLDSIRELEAAKNNELNSTDLIARAKVNSRMLEEIGPSIFYQIDSSLINSLVLVNSWRPSGGYYQSVYVEIFDTSKIELGKVYTIPNDLFKVCAIAHGHMRGAKLFENLNGTIRFDQLDEDYTVAKLFLK